MWTHRPLQTFLKIFHREKDNWWALTSIHMLLHRQQYNLKLKTSKLPVIPLFWFLLCRCLVLMKMFLCPIQAGLCIKPLWEYTSITTLMSVILQPHLNEPHSQAIRVRAAYALICTSNNLILYVMCQWICKKHQINLIIIRIIVLLSFPND